MAIWALFWFHINFWNICSSSLKYAIGILIGIALTLLIALGGMDILVMRILPVQEHSMLPLVSIFFNFFLQCPIILQVQVFYILG